MATEQQIAANRRNAQLSTGPKTEQGRKVSRLNALRHGLTGQIEVTTPEEKEAKTKFFTEIITALAPENAVEHQFAHSIADGHWRLNRASSIENNIFTLACSFEEKQAEQVRHEAELDKDASGEQDNETEDPEVEKALGAARVFIADPKRFQLLTIYEGRIHRTMSKNLKHLTELQTARRSLQAETESIQKAQREQALDEARLHTQLAEMEGVPCDIADFPDPNGFIFSTAEIAQTIRRIRHLQAARSAESSNWSPAIRRAA